jgi:hypothetical protein
MIVIWEYMFFLKYYFKSAIALIIGLMFIHGCAASISKQVALVYPQNNQYGEWPDKNLEKRFQEYWFNRYAGRVADAYNIETPYLREVVRLGKYNNYVKHTPNNKLVNVEIRKINKETDFLISISCVIRMQAVDGKQINASIIDRWVFSGNDWYHVIKDPILLSF